MTLPQMIAELSEIAPQFGLKVRLENGRFTGGLCTVNGEQLIVLNKRHPPERQFAVLAASLRSAPLDDVYLKPSLRRALEEAWERLDRGADAPGDGEADDE